MSGLAMRPAGTPRGGKAWWLAGLLAWCAFVSPATALATTDVDPMQTARPAMRIYTDRDGLPENSIFDFDIDPRGYLWVASENGPAYYDGRRWRSLELPAGIGSRFVRALLAASDGSIWLAMDEAGVLRHRDGRWTVFDQANGFVSDRTTDVIEQPRTGQSPVVWAGTNAGLVRFEGDRWQVFAQGLHERTITRLGLSLQPDAIWVGTRRGVARFAAGEFDASLLALPDAPRSQVTGIAETAAADGSRRLWISSSWEGLAIHENGAWQRLESPSLRMFPLLVSQAADGDTLWVGTYGEGLLRWRKGEWTTFDSAWGMPSDVIRSLRETISPEGQRTLWIGTQGGGLVRMHASGWRAFDRRSGLPSNYVGPIAEARDADGGRSLWVGTNRGLARWRNGQWTTHGVADGLPPGEVSDIAVGPAGDGSDALWCVVGGRVARFSREQWRTWGQDSLLGLTTYTIGIDDAGLAYVDGVTGLVQFDEDGAAVVDDATDTLANVFWVESTPAPENGRILWVFSPERIVHRQHSVWHTEGIAPPPISNVASLTLTWDASGKRRLWVGGRGSGGPFTLDMDEPGAAWRNLRERVRAPLPESVVDMRRHPDGSVYLFSTRGVVRLAPRDSPEDGHEYDAITFRSDDGLPSERINYTGSYIDHAGRVWAGTLGGVAVFDPRTYTPDRSPKPLYIDRAQVVPDGAAVAPGAVLESSQNSLRFELALVSTFREEETRFRTELVGFDARPGDWGVEALREITNLPAGSYRFRAWGRDWAGNVSGPVELPFLIRSPWWNWWGAWLAYALGLLLLGWCAVRWRTLRLRRRAEELHSMVEARTGELLQSNAHLEQSKREVEAAHARLVGTQQQLVMQEKMAALGTLTAGVAHEINNPTNFADGAVQRLRQQHLELHEFLRTLAGADAPARVLEAIAQRFEGLREMTDTAHEGHERIKRIVADLRQFTRLDEAERKSVPIADPIRSTVNLVRTRFDRVRFDLDLGFNPEIECQPAKLGQVFMNLVVNACEAIGECRDGREGVVRIATRAVDGRVEVVVEDNGAGMDEATRQRVFEPFFTTKDVGAGTGLGLAIVFGIVRDHGGSVEVESAPGKGTRFGLRLPHAR